MDHLCDRVNIARANDDADGPRTCCGLLCGGPVLATGGQHCALIGDVILDRERFNLAHQCLVRDEATVAHMQPEPFALNCCCVLVGHTRCVAGQRGVDANADVWLHLERRRSRPAQPDFFLCREHHVNLRSAPF